MAFSDMREFMEALERTGDLARVKQEVDWDMEVGAIVRRSCERRGPAILFEKLKDYPLGYQILGAPVATHRRLAIAMGLRPDTHVRDIQSEFLRRIERPIKPIVVGDAPCKENVLQGDEIDLLRFPAPMVHEGDGGRYIGTFYIMITRDPTSGWVNWGLYRAMVHNRKTLAVLLVPPQHQGKHFYENYAPQKRPMPFAMALGVEPLSCIMAATPLDAGVSEVDFAGALRQEPVKLVRCHTSDLLVPADAEIVIEGEVMPDTLVPEGPFGEFTGYRTEMGWRPAYAVKAITHRRNPILPLSNPGMPADENHSLGICRMAAISKRLKMQGIPITGVNLPLEASQHMLVIGVRKRSRAAARKIARAIKPDLSLSLVVLVDEDVDVFNLAEVVHALATKCHPGRGIKIARVPPTTPLTPYLSPEERRLGKGAKALFDCTWPIEWSKETQVPPRCSFDSIYSSQTRARVLRNWKKYGLP